MSKKLIAIVLFLVASLIAGEEKCGIEGIPEGTCNYLNGYL